MARRRKYGEDLAFAEWHRHRLPFLYERIGHVLDMCDRGWAEFCHFCGEPFALVEEVVDKGQNLDEKAIRMTKALADAGRIEAYLLAPRINRSRELQAEIKRLQDKIIELQTKDPIEYFTIKTIWPHHGELTRISERECVDFIISLHRAHHNRCRITGIEPNLPVVNMERLDAFREKIGIARPEVQPLLFPVK